MASPSVCGKWEVVGEILTTPAWGRLQVTLASPTWSWRPSRRGQGDVRKACVPLLRLLPVAWLVGSVSTIS